MSRTYPGLTSRMAKLMAIIESYVEAYGHGPSFEDMQRSMGLKSKSSIHRLVTSLENRGYISRIPTRARAIEILKPSLAPVVRVTVHLNHDGSFSHLGTGDSRPVVLINRDGFTRPATAEEVIAA